MRFSTNIHQPKVPAWLDHYVDYDALKHLISNPQRGDLAAALSDEVELVTRFSDRRLTSARIQISRLSDLWCIPWRSGLGDDAMFLAMPLCELRYLSLVVRECIHEVLDICSYITVNTEAFRILSDKSTIAKNTLAAEQQAASIHSLGTTLSKCLALVDNLNHYLALIETSLQTEAKARPRSLLLENVFNHSTSTRLVTVLARDDLASLLQIWPLKDPSTPEGRVGVIECLIQGAVIYGSVQCLGFLLSQLTADLKMSGATGSLLHDVIRQAYASRSSDRPQDSVHEVYRVLNLILAEGGPLLQVTDSKGQLPLHIAAKYGLEKVCTQIVSAIRRGEGEEAVRWDADLNGQSPLDTAACNGHLATLMVLNEAAKGSSSSKLLRRTEALAMAILLGHEELADFLASNDIGILYKSRTGRTVLHLAVERGLVVVVKSLLAAKMEVNICDSQGVTPILLASSQGKLKIVEALLSAGADATVTDSRGWLPKDYAAYHGHLELAQKLPGKGSSVIHADLGKKTPARTILPVRSPGDSVIFVNIGTLDLRKGDVVGIDLEPYKLKQLPRVVAETGLVLRISLVGDECQSYTEALPILTDRSDVPWCFRTPAPDQAALLFQIQRRGDDQPIAAAVALLSSLNSGLGPRRESLVREYTLPLLDNGFWLAGSLTFSLVTARPYALGEQPVMKQQKLKPSEITCVGGHRGNGQNNGKQEQLQIGENTIQSFQTAIDHGATVVEFDVQVTKDGVPVIYHDFLVVEKGMDATMHTLKLEQFMAISDRQSRSHYYKNDSSALKSTHQRRQSTGTTTNDAEVEGLIHQMKHTLNYPGYKANLRTNNVHEAFIKLEELFHGLSEDVVLDMEIKYPMLFEADDFEMDTYALELNYFVDTILSVVFKHSGPKRQIIISTFSPEVCMLLTVKQQIYPVVFLNDSSVWPTGDPRTVSTQSAVHFARQFGLAGVAMAAEPFVLAPGLIGLVKERGLFTMSYGNLNDEIEAAKVQAEGGLDVIIANQVKKIVQALKGPRTDI